MAWSTENEWNRAEKKIQKMKTEKAAALVSFNLYDFLSSVETVLRFGWSLFFLSSGHRIASRGVFSSFVSLCVCVNASTTIECFILETEKTERNGQTKRSFGTMWNEASRCVFIDVRNYFDPFILVLCRLVFGTLFLSLLGIQCSPFSISFSSNFAFFSLKFLNEFFHVCFSFANYILPLAPNSFAKFHFFFCSFHSSIFVLVCSSIWFISAYWSNKKERKSRKNTRATIPQNDAIQSISPIQNKKKIAFRFCVVVSLCNFVERFLFCILFVATIDVGHRTSCFISFFFFFRCRNWTRELRLLLWLHLHCIQSWRHFIFQKKKRRKN